MRWALDTVTRQLNSRIINPFPRSGLIIKHSVEDELRKSFSSNWRGVMVYWGIQVSGKSTHIQNVLQKIQKEENRPMVYISASMYQPSSTPHEWFRTGLGLSKTVDDYSQYLPAPKDINSPTIIVLDQFDHLIHDKYAASFITGLGEIARNTGLFSVLLPITSASDAVKMLNWNGGEKIKLFGYPGCGMWIPENVNELIDTVYNEKDWSVSHKIRMKEMGSIAGSPGFIHDLMDGNFHGNEKVVAEYLRSEWENGKKLFDVVKNKQW